MIHKRACIVGAGSSGIATVKAFADAKIDFDCFEKSDRVGGNWVYGNKNGMSAAYEGLYINTSRDRMQYADYPMPRTYPDFPHHSQIARYFDDYVDHFGLRPKVTFETGVVKAQLEGRGPSAKWRVRTEGAVSSERTYDFLLVANGHHWDAMWPDPPYPGAKEFQGRQLHSHDYRTKDELRGKRVLVVGMGNSAMDIAVESSECAAATFLSARRGVHVVPKYMFGKPLDQIVTTTKLPWAVRRKMAETIHRITVGDMERYGLPKPDHRILDAHPTISGRILDRLTHGTIKPKPGLTKLGPTSVTFTDGTVEDVDVIVWATGYRVTFPFFEEDFVKARDNDLPLFFRVFHPDHPQLAFVGLLQPLGAIMPLAEAQSKWLAQYIRGEYVLPPASEMRRRMEAERKRMFARYVPSKRHTMQVDFDDYLDDIRDEIARGVRRAK
ncbi:MAG: NAD(P)-binding domain-containing protein [Deltaproteobacteria bacterium]|nr:NAD(P)-binding domain-containing protein [Deltaproteobacteria bacterium]